MSNKRRMVACSDCGKLIRLSVKSGKCRKCFNAGLSKGGATHNPTDSIGGSTDTLEIAQTTSKRVRTLADLVKVCEIDLTEWDVDRWVCNKWDMGAMQKERDGTVAVTGKPVVTEIFQVKAWLKRKTRQEKTLRALADALLNDLRQTSKAVAVRKRWSRSDFLFEFPPFDLHMGKYAWDEETVTNYDVKQAEDLFNASLDYLLEQALKTTDNRLGQILCVFGNDVVHIDNKSGTTTAGTRMDVDTRYIRVFRRAVEVHRRALDILTQYAPVDVVVVPGNHDEMSSFMLGEVLAAAYDRNRRITFDNGAKPRKYYEYGTNLFGFTHGDKEKVTELPLSMAREKKDAWARCESREWHIGHKHITERWETPGRIEQDHYSDKGVRIRRLTSLSGHDAWHTAHAYMDRRACEGFVFHRTAGFTAQHSFNVDHFKGTPLVIKKGKAS